MNTPKPAPKPAGVPWQPSGRPNLPPRLDAGRALQPAPAAVGEALTAPPPPPQPRVPPAPAMTEALDPRRWQPIAKAEHAIGKVVELRPSDGSPPIRAMWYRTRQHQPGRGWTVATFWAYVTTRTPVRIEVDAWRPYDPGA
jgi:hypothetical protein